MISICQFQKIVSQIHQSLEETQVYQAIAKQFCSALESDCAGLILYDWSNQSLKVAATYYTRDAENITRCKAPIGLTLRLGAGLEGTAIIRHRTPWVVQDIKTDLMPEVEQLLLVASGLDSTLMVPIVFANQLLGTAYVSQIQSCRLWTTQEMDLARLLAEQAAIAIHNANVHASVQRQAQREKLLNRVQKRIRSALDIDTRIKTALAELLPLIDADWMLFAVQSAESATGVEIRHQIRRHEEKWAKPQHHRGKVEMVRHGEPSLATYHPLTFERVAKPPQLELETCDISFIKTLLSSESCAIAHSQIAKLDEHCRASFQDQQIGALITVPVVYQDTILGHIWAIKHDPINWTKHDVLTIEVVAEQLSIAITQAQLHQKTREQAAAAQLQAQELAAALEEKMQLINSLHATQAQLIQSEKMSSLGQLVAGVAHEINNPMNFIYGNIPFVAHYAKELLELLHLYQTKYCEPNDEIAQRAAEIDLEFVTHDLMRILDSMQNGSQRVREIVLTLRNFSRLDEADRKWVDIHEGIESTLVLLSHRLKHRLQVEKFYSELPAVECYPSQLNQVFMNLLTNAIDAINANINGHGKASPGGLITITTTLIKVDIDPEDWVQIQISDNGSGIKPEHQSRIFDPFFTTKQVGSGTGLGLAIAYKIIVEKHQGKIWFKSTPGLGTEFLLELPIKQ